MEWNRSGLKCCIPFLATEAGDYRISQAGCKSLELQPIYCMNASFDFHAKRGKKSVAFVTALSAPDHSINRWIPFPCRLRSRHRIGPHGSSGDGTRGVCFLRSRSRVIQYLKLYKVNPRVKMTCFEYASSRLSILLLFQCRYKRWSKP